MTHVLSLTYTQASAAVLVGLFMPLLISVAVQTHWPEVLKTLTSLAFYPAAAVIVAAASGAFTWASAWQTGVIVFVVGSTSYQAIWKPSRISPAIEYSTRLFEPRFSGVVSSQVVSSIKDLAQADRSDVQTIAASQLNLMTGFYEIALAQARYSFRWAIAGSVAGVAFFMAAIGFLLGSGAHDAAVYSAIGGGVVEVIAGINFVLYSRATSQLLGFHSRLDKTQRFLLANSICESLDEPTRTQTRSRLVSTVATGTDPTIPEPGRMD